MAAVVARCVCAMCISTSRPHVVSVTALSTLPISFDPASISPLPFQHSHRILHSFPPQTPRKWIFPLKIPAQFSGRKTQPILPPPPKNDLHRIHIGRSPLRHHSILPRRTECAVSGTAPRPWLRGSRKLPGPPWSNVEDVWSCSHYWRVLHPGVRRPLRCANLHTRDYVRWVRQKVM